MGQTISCKARTSGAIWDDDGQCWSSSLLLKSIKSSEWHLFHHGMAFEMCVHLAVVNVETFTEKDQTFLILHLTCLTHAWLCTLC